jgi:hypothetical protein
MGKSLNMAAPDTPRIIIAAHSFADAKRAIVIAVALAKSVGADLHGILAAHALEFPGATLRLITTRGAVLPSPSMVQMRQFLAADARAFEAELAAQAVAALRQWSFEHITGDVLSRIAEVTARGDILLIGQHGLYRQRGPVVLILGTTGADRAIETATILAQTLRTALHLCTVAASAEDQQRCLTTLQARSQTIAVPNIVVQVFTTTTKMLAQINRSAATAVVVDLNSGPLHTETDLRALQIFARSPVVIVGPAPTT